MDESQTAGTLTCEQCRELLSGYVDHEVTASERAAIEHHLATCPRCANESSVLVGLKNVLAHWEGVRSTPSFQEAVLTRMARESSGLSSPRPPSGSEDRGDPSEDEATPEDSAESDQLEAQGLNGDNSRQRWLLVLVATLVLFMAAILVLYFAGR